MTSLHEEASCSTAPVGLDARSTEAPSRPGSMGWVAEALMAERKAVVQEMSNRHSALLKELEVAATARPQEPQKCLVAEPPCDICINSKMGTSFVGADDTQENLSPRRKGIAEVRAMIGELAKQQEVLNNSLVKLVVPQPGVLPRISTTSASSEVGHKSTTTRSDKKSKIPPRRSEWRVHHGGSHPSLGEASITSFSSRQDNNSCRSLLRYLVNSKFFMGLVSAVLMSYAVMIAIETEQLAITAGEESSTMAVMHIGYSVFFAIELLVRIGAERRKFLFGKSTFLNWFDTILVVSLLVDVSLSFLASSVDTAGEAGPMLRTLRVVRVVRTMRLVRTFHLFHEFQKMAFALASSLRTLVHSMLVVFFVICFFAVIFTQLAADKELRGNITDLELRYGGLATTIFTLFLSMSNGISWHRAYEPLAAVGWGLGATFICYIVISLFGVLNVVTSVFVESVIRSAQHHRDVIVQDKEQEKLVALGHMQQLFREIDTDDSGLITSDELAYFLKEPALRKYMEALDVSLEDTRLLFTLLDRDSSGQVDLEEFCQGCLRLKGNAKALDVQTLLLQMQNFFNKWEGFTDFVAEQLDKSVRQR